MKAATVLTTSTNDILCRITPARAFVPDMTTGFSGVVRSFLASGISSGRIGERSGRSLGLTRRSRVAEPRPTGVA
jgi:hypothetical protein